MEFAAAGAILAPLVCFLVPALVGGKDGAYAGLAALIFPFLSAGLLLFLAASTGAHPLLAITWDWVPSLGVSFSLLVDGLSLFFGLIVSVMGILIVFYALQYMTGHYKNLAHFYCYLLLFMSAMLGTVLSDHLLLMFGFWELTGLASYLLIGFLHEQRASRIGARQALIVTSATGLVMLAGILLLGHEAGTYRISELAGLRLAEQPTPALQTALVLLLVGAFGKSAQFPFFFWLPNAMAAPTPVSAYLHSATMVKLGVFLCARLFAIFSGFEAWPVILVSVGFLTMVLGGALALFQHDLKAMLAFSTVSMLGFLCGYYGVGALAGIRYDFLHILNHTLYKGGLFMIAGIIDHAAHNRDIRQLGGLARRMPLLAVAAAVCLASMAGLPGTTGFLSKEAVLADLLALREHGLAGSNVMLALFVIGALLNAIIAVRFFAETFLGAPRGEGAAHAHKPALPLLLPPLLLAGAILALGIRTSLLDSLLHAWHVAGLQAAQVDHLHLWHGITPELLISLGVLLGGLLAWAAGARLGLFACRVPGVLDFGAHFEASLRGLRHLARSVTQLLQTENPASYILIVLVTVLALLGGASWAGGLFTDFMPGVLEEAGGSHTDWLRLFIAILIASAVAAVLTLKRWTTQLICLSVAGFLTTFYFVIYRAPDLALTQILVESVSLLLILLLLGRFPKSAEAGERTMRPGAFRRAFHIVVAAAMGLMMTTLILAMTSKACPDLLGTFYLERTLDLAKGSNAVNTVLVDFRGFDTLGEITVLLVATLGCLGLLVRYKRSPEEYERGASGAAGFSEAERREDRP